MTTSGEERLKVLIVEDESLVAMLIEDVLAELGHEAIAVSAHLNDALEKARTLDIDMAVVDINLNGQRTDPVAEVLFGRGIPFLFASGYGAAGLAEAWAHVPVVTKPFQPKDLTAAINAALRR